MMRSLAPLACSPILCPPTNTAPSSSPTTTPLPPLFSSLLYLFSLSLSLPKINISLSKRGPSPLATVVTSLTRHLAGGRDHRSTAGVPHLGATATSLRRAGTAGGNAAYGGGGRASGSRAYNNILRYAEGIAGEGPPIGSDVNPCSAANWGSLLSFWAGTRSHDAHRRHAPSAIPHATLLLSTRQPSMKEEVEEAYTSAAALPLYICHWNC